MNRVGGLVAVGPELRDRDPDQVVARKTFFSSV